MASVPKAAPIAPSLRPSEVPELDASCEKKYTYYVYEEASSIGNILYNMFRAVGNLFIWIGNAWDERRAMKSLKEKEVKVVTENPPEVAKKTVQFAERLEQETPVKSSPAKARAKPVPKPAIKKSGAEHCVDALKGSTKALGEASSALKSAASGVSEQMDALATEEVKLELVIDRLEERGFTNQEVRVLGQLGNQQLIKPVSEKVVALIEHDGERITQRIAKKLGRAPTENEVKQVKEKIFNDKVTLLLTQHQRQTFEQLLGNTDEQNKGLRVELAALGEASPTDHKMAALTGLAMGVGVTLATSYMASYLTSCVTTPVAEWLKDPSFSYVGGAIRGTFSETTADWIIGGVKGIEFPATKAAYETVKSAVSYVTPDFIENLFTYTPSAEVMEAAKQSLTQGATIGPLNEEATIALERVTRERFLESAPWYHTACDKALNSLGMLASARKLRNWGKVAAVGAFVIPQAIGTKKGIALDLALAPQAASIIASGVSEYAKDPLHAIDKEDDFVVRDMLSKRIERVQNATASYVIPSTSKITGGTTAGRKTYDQAYGFAKVATAAFLFTSVLASATVAVPVSLAVGAGATYMRSGQKSA